MDRVNLVEEVGAANGKGCLPVRRGVVWPVLGDDRANVAGSERFLVSGNDASSVAATNPEEAVGYAAVAAYPTASWDGGGWGQTPSWRGVWRR